jgi:hypothetical protein
MTRRTPPNSVYQRATLRSRSRARVEVLVSEMKPGAWKLTTSCGHTSYRNIGYRVDGTRLPPPKHVYCIECPLRRQQPFEHEERLAEFDARLASEGGNKR